MAIFKAGSIATEVRGKIGGLVYSRNKGGLYVRSIGVPVQPDSELQAQQRSRMAELMAAWASDLSAAERAAWEVYAANTTWYNSLGDAITLSGSQFFLRTNILRLQCSLPRIDAAPTVAGIGSRDPLSLNTIAISEADQELSFQTWTPSLWNTSPTSGLAVFIGKPVNASVNNYAGSYRFAKFVAGATPTPPSAPYTADVPFAVSQGQRVFFYTRMLSADGKVSTAQRASAIVEA